MLDHSGLVWNYYCWEEISIAKVKDYSFVMYGQRLSKSDAVKEAKKLAYENNAEYLGVDGEKEIIE